MAKFNVDKAKAGGMSDEAIQAYLKGHPELEAKGNFSGNMAQDILHNAPAAIGESIKELQPTVHGFLDKNITQHLPETGKTRSTVANAVIGTPRVLADTANEFVSDNLSPTSLAINAATLGAGEIIPPIAKGTSKVLGKTLSGKSMKQIGRLFDEPTAMLSGAKESITNAARKAFGAAKEAEGVRGVKEGIDAFESPRQALKRFLDPDLRAAYNARVQGLLEGGAAQSKAMKYAAKEMNIPEKALEARQAIDDLPSGKLSDPSVQVERKKLNTVLDKVAPEIRAVDPKISKAKLGQDFLQFLPEGFTRRLISTASLGATPFSPAASFGAAAFSPFTTGVATSLAGAGSKALQGLSRSGMRRALISALASRMNKPDEEGK